MNSRTLLVVVVLAALAVAGAVFVLSSGEPAGEGGSASHKQDAGADALPSFESDVAGRAETREQVARPVDVPRAAPATAAIADEPAAAPVDFGPLRKLSGKVLRASDGTPIGGVTLEWQVAFTALTLAEGQSIPTASSAADGSFRYEVPVSASKLTLTLSTNGATQDFPLEPGKDELELELVFDSGFRIEGHVTDGNLTPIAQAKVECGGALVQTGREGQFQLRDVWADKQPVVKVKASAPLRTRAEADVLVPRSPSDIPGVDLKLLGAGRIAGTVTYSHGAAAAGATVEAVLRMHADEVGDTLSDAEAACDGQGVYALDHVPEGRYIVQVSDRSETRPRIDASGVMTIKMNMVSGGASRVPLGAWLQDIAVEEGQTTRLDVVLPVGAKLAGRVIDDAGRPVAGARLDLQRRTHWPTPNMNGNSVMISDGLVVEASGSADGTGQATMSRPVGDTVSDDNGRYEFSGLSAGEHRLAVSDPSGHLAPAVRDLVLRGDEQLETVDFALAAGLTLRSRVLDPEGRPLAGASVYISNLDSHSIGQKDFIGQTGQDGFFETHGLTAGKKRISISLTGYSWLWDEVDPAAPPPAFTLKPAPMLHGLVLDAATGEPVPAFSLKIEYENSTMMTDVQPHEGGAFEEDVGDDKSCKVTVGAPGYKPLTLENIVPSTTANRPVQFRLVPGAERGRWTQRATLRRP